MGAHLRYRDLLCPGCDTRWELVTREDVLWDITSDTVCRKCASRAVYTRHQEEQHKDDKPAPGKSLWSEGRTVSAFPVFMPAKS